MSVPIQILPFDERVATLLQSSNLPTEDLPGNPDVALFGYMLDRTVLGVVGLELYESTALLRSLAVAPDHRRLGLGDALLQHAELAAAARGVKDLYLLTTTAEQYFLKRGYSAVSRDLAPAAIGRTRQFADLCPSSSAFLVKRFG